MPRLASAATKLGMRLGDLLGEQEFVRARCAAARLGVASSSRRFRWSATRSPRTGCLSRYRRRIRRRVAPQARPLQNPRAGRRSRTASPRRGRARPGRSRPQGRFRWSTMDRADETTLAEQRELCPLVAHMVIATALKSKLRPRRRAGQVDAVRFAHRRRERPPASTHAPAGGAGVSRV